MENREINRVGVIPQLGGPHLKKCICGCGEQFYGRLNQKFLNLEHKAKVNNQIRSELNKPLKNAWHQIKVNYRLLERFYPESKGEPIKFSKIIAMGFDLNSYFKVVKFPDKKDTYQQLEDYCFLISAQFTEITIYKLKITNNGNQ